jgi:choline kinase
MDRNDAVTQTVILAAGHGSRLASTRGNVPKPLMTVGGIPLVARALTHARAAGCTEALIVIGHEGARVKHAIESLEHPLPVRFVATPDPSLPNGVSLLASEPMVGPRFFLQMVDHLFAGIALRKLIATPLQAAEGGRVLVDRAPVNLDLDDATKVQLTGTRVSAIGKGIEPWDAIDAGCFLLTHAIFEALRRAPVDEPRSVSSGMRQLVAQGLLTAVDVDGTAWMDVDTPADREAAERMFATAAERSSDGESAGV